MSAGADRLRQHAASLGEPPHRVAGIPAGIISADDYDVTEEAFAALAAYPDLARLLAQALDALACPRCERGEARIPASNSLPAAHESGPCRLTNKTAALLADADRTLGTVT